MATTKDKESKSATTATTTKTKKERKPYKPPISSLKLPNKYHNSPVISDGGYLTEDGDNSKFNALSLELFNLPTIDRKDVKQVEEQLNRYFQIYIKYDMKPTVSGMAMALGMNRQMLAALVNGYPSGGAGYLMSVPPEVADLIKRAYNILEVGWENYMLAYKINPVAGIFLAKNNFQYRDQTDISVSPGEQPTTLDVDDIRKRYMIESNDSADSE